jgi:hypothetical protein
MILLQVAATVSGAAAVFISSSILAVALLESNQGNSKIEELCKIIGRLTGDAPCV